MEQDDEALVLACRRGDEAAWESLVTRYQRLIYGILRHARLDQDQCADAFQHVFATLVEQLDRIEQPSRVGAWLVTTARREAWRVQRRERAVAGSLSRVSTGERERDDETSGVEELPDGAPIPEQVLLRLEEQHLVRTAVGSLDERCRRLLTMLYFRPDPPAYAEIAVAFGTSEGSIGPTRARCLEKLRRLLLKQGY